MGVGTISQGKSNGGVIMRLQSIMMGGAVKLRKGNEDKKGDEAVKLG